MTDERLYFTIGPVQGFVNQSRRTRDLWASSYLLSLLSNEAIKTVEDLGGEIIIPYRTKGTDPTKSVDDFAPLMGNVPNRFIATHAGTSNDLSNVAQQAVKAVMDCWRVIAKKVRDKYVIACVSQNQNTLKIWDRQIENFWEINWIVSEEDAALDQRKNWRTTPATVEPGDHCTLMGDWQELSGYIRALDRKKQDDFWDTLRSQNGIGLLDFDENERLCAIALIKRLYPKLINREAVNWPSTPYIAAIPWLNQLACKFPAEGNGYAKAIREVAEHSLGERHSNIKCLIEHPNKKETGNLFKLDGNFFHYHALANPKATPLEKKFWGDEESREKLLKELKNLYEKIEDKPSPFYAVLLMDGDSMGAILRQARDESKTGEQTVSQALAHFAKEVARVVRDHDGVPVYAGGDDVMALLPMRHALSCAITLRDCYQTSFDMFCSKSIVPRATISAAIMYAHYHVPLRQVLDLGHELLEKIAKNRTGRDSLSVRVFKPSGITCEWSAPWDHIQPHDVLMKLVEKFQGEDRGTSERKGEFSSSFFYNIRDQFALLTNDDPMKPGEFGPLVKDLDAQKILVAEWIRTRQRGGDQRSSEELLLCAEENIDLLLKTCYRARRVPDDKNEPKLLVDDKVLGIDGPLLVRFLANEGKEVSE